MFSKVLASALVTSCLWLAGSTIHALRSDSPSRVQGVQSSTPQFIHTANTPDPNSIFSQVNAIRQLNGLQPLKTSSDLALVAQTRAMDMAARNYYAHETPEGTYYYDLFNTNHFYTDYSCENLDMDYSLDARQYVNDWLGSNNGHRECLLNPAVTDAGYAVVKTADTVYEGSLSPTYIVVAIHATAPSPN